MSGPEKATYLANVISVARADGEISSGEAAVLRDVVQRIEADDVDLNAARDLIGAGDYRLSPLNIPSQRMANIEDMTLMALADGHLDDVETNAIERLSEVMHFSQADMNIIVKRAETRLRRMGGNSTPPLPGEPVAPAPERTTRESGHGMHAAQTQAPAPRPSSPPPIEPAAPARPSVAPQPTPDPSEKVARPGLGMSPPSTGGLRSPLPPAGKVAPRLPSLPECIKARRAADAPEYCFGAGGCLNNWGCRLIGMDWSAGAVWFDMGGFRDDRTFVFDRERITETVRDALEEVLTCPFLDRELVEDALRRFPVRAVVGPRWKYRMATAAQPGRHVLVRESRHGITLHTQAVAACLEPVGTRDAELLIGRVLRDCGRRDVDVRKLRI